MKRIKALTIASLILLILGISGLISNLNLQKIQEGNKRVWVTILDVPEDCDDYDSYRDSPHFRFALDGRVYYKDIIAEYCNKLKKNDTLLLKTNDDYSGFLFENEDVSSEVVACIAIMAAGAIIFFVSLKNEKVEIKQANYKKKKKPLQPKMGRYGNKI